MEKRKIYGISLGLIGVLYIIIQTCFYHFTNASSELGCHAQNVFKTHNQKFNEIRRSKFDTFTYKHFVSQNLEKRKIVLDSLKSMEHLQIKSFDLFGLNECRDYSFVHDSVYAYNTQLNQLEFELENDLKNLESHERYIDYQNDLKVLCNLQNVVIEFRNIERLIYSNRRETASKNNRHSNKFKEDYKQLSVKYDQTKIDFSKKWDISIDDTDAPCDIES